MSEICYVVVYWKFLYFSRWPSAVDMDGGKKQSRLVELRPIHVRNFHF